MTPHAEPGNRRLKTLTLGAYPANQRRSRIWGYPFGVDVDKIPVGGILIRAGLETAADYSYAEGPDTSRVVLDVLMNQGSDWSYLEKLYDRMTDVEKALEGMRATAIPTPTPASPAEPEGEAEKSADAENHD